MFPRLAEQYRTVVQDLVMSLQALARSLQDRGFSATCYVCGDGRDGHGASFVANLGSHHMVQLEGAEAIQELQRVAQVLQQGPADGRTSPKATKPIAA